MKTVKFGRCDRTQMKNIFENGRNRFNDQVLAGQVNAAIEVAYEYPIMSSSNERNRLVDAFEDSALISCREIYNLD